jgi:hypothetical protein
MTAAKGPERPCQHPPHPTLGVGAWRAGERAGPPCLMFHVKRRAVRRSAMAPWGQSHRPPRGTGLLGDAATSSATTPMLRPSSGTASRGWIRVRRGLAQRWYGVDPRPHRRSSWYAERAPGLPNTPVTETERSHLSRSTTGHARRQAGFAGSQATRSKPDPNLRVARPAPASPIRSSAAIRARTRARRIASEPRTAAPSGRTWSAEAIGEPSVRNSTDPAPPTTQPPHKAKHRLAMPGRPCGEHSTWTRVHMQARGLVAETGPHRETLSTQDSDRSAQAAACRAVTCHPEPSCADGAMARKE